ncbi:hypothetical protein [Bradyrhizobium sp. 30]|uniref:hypothetical protein n=1 Tax=Bradyrhizobium sp. 30 TaxID=2782669 RepID=UPI001FFAEF7C|nr:hypothetical protein [Bradyrhizobium sp. 30]MCK1292556.1 hypothetical protein [Bradyrhizobium sp. 30]
MLPPREASQPTFAPLVVEGALEERQIPAIKLEIAIGDVVLRTPAQVGACSHLDGVEATYQIGEFHR